MCLVKSIVLACPLLASNSTKRQVEDGRVFSFGLNSNSQLALGFDNSSSRPLALPQEAVALRGSRDIRVGTCRESVR